jgi:hypothetical protein
MVVAFVFGIMTFSAMSVEGRRAYFCAEGRQTFLNIRHGFLYFK